LTVYLTVNFVLIGREIEHFQATMSAKNFIQSGLEALRCGENTERMMNTLGL
jgi:hypothetical protein